MAGAVVVAWLQHQAGSSLGGQLASRAALWTGREAGGAGQGLRLGPAEGRGPGVVGAGRGAYLASGRLGHSRRSSISPPGGTAGRRCRCGCKPPGSAGRASWGSRPGALLREERQVSWGSCRGGVYDWAALPAFDGDGSHVAASAAGPLSMSRRRPHVASPGSPFGQVGPLCPPPPCGG